MKEFLHTAAKEKKDPIHQINNSKQNEITFFFGLQI